MKKVILIVLTILIIACSSDDSSSEINLIDRVYAQENYEVIVSEGITHEYAFAVPTEDVTGFDFDYYDLNTNDDCYSILNHVGYERIGFNVIELTYDVYKFTYDYIDQGVLKTWTNTIIIDENNNLISDIEIINPSGVYSFELIYYSTDVDLGQLNICD